VRRPLLHHAAALAAAVLLAAPATAPAAVRLPRSGGGLVALAAGPGSAYAVVGTGGRAKPFRLVRSGGRGAKDLGSFGGPGADYADVAAGDGGPVIATARPTSDGYAYDSAAFTAGRFAAPAVLGEGTGPAVLGLDGATRVAVFPDDDGDAAITLSGGPAMTLTRTGPALRHTPLDAVVAGGRALVLDRVQSRSRSELRVLGPDAPTARVASASRRRPLEASIARDDERVYVAYSDGPRRLVLASAAAHAGARWSHRRLRVRGPLNGAPSVARVGLRTLVATSQRIGGRYRVFLTTAGPAGTFLDPLARSRGSELAPLVATGPDDRAYVAWTHRPRGRAARSAVLRRVV
jgi:hypothetical protein